jgi:hypothetical protein
MNLEETLFIVVIVVTLNILISYIYPILNSYSHNFKNMFSSYQRLILVNRQNLVASSINVIILAVLTIVLTPHVEKLLKMNKQTPPSIFDLNNLNNLINLTK